MEGTGNLRSFQQLAQLEKTTLHMINRREVLLTLSVVDYRWFIGSRIFQKNWFFSRIGRQFYRDGGGGWGGGAQWHFLPVNEPKKMRRWARTKPASNNKVIFQCIRKHSICQRTKANSFTCFFEVLFLQLTSPVRRLSLVNGVENPPANHTPF